METTARSEENKPAQAKPAAVQKTPEQLKEETRSIKNTILWIRIWLRPWKTKVVFFSGTERQCRDKMVYFLGGAFVKPVSYSCTMVDPNKDPKKKRFVGTLIYRTK